MHSQAMVRQVMQQNIIPIHCEMVQFPSLSEKDMPSFVPTQHSFAVFTETDTPAQLGCL